jgi:signal transduction histidine kinase
MKPEGTKQPAGSIRRAEPSFRRLLVPFAMTGTLGLVLGLAPWPSRAGEAVAVVVLVVSCALLVRALPYPNVRGWLRPVVPVVDLIAFALLRDVRGGLDSGVTVLFFLPVVFVACYGQRRDLIITLVAATVLLALPIVVVGAPRYPASSWRLAVLYPVVMALVGLCVHTTVSRQRRGRELLEESRAELKQREQLAVARREELDAVMRAARETAIVGCDSSGLITFFSPGAEQVLGHAASDVVQKVNLAALVRLDELEVVAGRHHVGASFDALLAHGRCSDHASRWTFVRANGRSVRVALVLTPLQENEKEEDAGYVVVATDCGPEEAMVREQGRLLRRERRAAMVLAQENQHLQELNELKDEVVATVSHELRTPLTSVRGFVDLLRDGEGGPLNEDQRRMLSFVDRGAQQLVRLVEDLLLLSRATAGRLDLRMAPVELNALVATVVAAAEPDAAQRGVHLAAQGDAESWVDGDSVRLNQLIGNLVSNALKFTPIGGRVEVHTGQIGNNECIEVRDTGPGIPVAERERLFDRFYRRTQAREQAIPGAGLGLPIARTIAQAHGGDVRVVDAPDWSTTFRVTLPSRSAPGQDQGTESARDQGNEQPVLPAGVVRS